MEVAVTNKLGAGLTVTNVSCLEGLRCEDDRKQERIKGTEKPSPIHTLFHW